MSKTRKQHIENLKHLLTYKIIQAFVKSSSIQYAIDHLSREWVSRKCHRAKIKELNLYSKHLISMYNKASTQREELYSEIDHLKADKDRMQSELNDLETRKDTRIATLIYQRDGLQSDWEKESDKVSNLQNKVKWLSITTAILLITLIFSLLNCG